MALVTKKYSSNTIEILLHYLTQSIIGPQIPDDEIDINGTFAECAKIADELINNSVSLKGKFYGETVTRQLRRHEFHGLLYPDVDHISNIEKLLNTIPGAILFRSVDGLLKISIPKILDYKGDPLSAKDQIVAVITDDVLEGDLEYSQTDTDSRLNQVKVNFRNISKDFALDSYEIISETFKAQDNGLSLIEEVTVDGINNIYQAEAYARALLESSRLPYLSFKTTHEMFRLEPGDVVRIYSERNDSSAIVRILTTNLNTDFTISFESNIYDPVAYDAIESILQISYNPDAFRVDRSLSAPLEVVAELIDNADSIVRSVLLTFAPSDNVNVREYEVQSSVNVGGNLVYTTIGTVTDDPNLTSLDRLSFIHSPNYIETYNYRVRAKTATGVLSAWSETVSATVTIDEISGAEPTLLFSDTVPRSTPINTDRLGGENYDFNGQGYRGQILIRVDGTGFEATNISINGNLLTTMSGTSVERKSHLAFWDITQDSNRITIWADTADTGTIHSVSVSIVVKGSDGEDSISVEIVSSAGTSFRNNQGANKSLTVVVKIGGIESLNYSGYKYTWFANGLPAYVFSNQSYGGTSSGGSLFIADGNDPAGLNFRSISINPNLVPDDSNLNLSCTVSNIT